MFAFLFSYKEIRNFSKPFQDKLQNHKILELLQQPLNQDKLLQHTHFYWTKPKVINTTFATTTKTTTTLLHTSEKTLIVQSNRNGSGFSKRRLSPTLGLSSINHFLLNRDNNSSRTPLARILRLICYRISGTQSDS